MQETDLSAVHYAFIVFGASTAAKEQDTTIAYACVFKTHIQLQVAAL